MVTVRPVPGSAVNEVPETLIEEPEEASTTQGCALARLNF